MHQHADAGPLRLLLLDAVSVFAGDIEIDGALPTAPAKADAHSQYGQDRDKPVLSLDDAFSVPPE